MTLLPSHAAHAEAGHDDEAEMLQLVNSARASNGLPGLAMDGRLQQDSRNYSAHIKNVKFEHDTNMPWYDCGLKSENIASGQRTVSDVYNAFMNSAAHRENILRSGINAVGFGVSYSASGAMYTVQRFYNCPSVAGSQWTSGPIKSKWLALGATPSLGRYQGTPAPVSCGGGQYQVFGGGSDTGVQSSAIYHHPQVDGGRAHVTSGSIWSAWSAMRYECGPLGYPTTDPFSISNCRAAVNPVAQGFQGGIIEASGATGAHALVPGRIFDRFAASNGHCGVAGLPTSEVYDWPGYETVWRVQIFEFRYIVEHKPTGQTYICTYQGACA
ncbi:MAG: CAP domain-containing protein [Acidimicrobiales bacterium]